MKFPLNYIDEEIYNKKLIELINDKNCIFFIDTNIISQFYKLHDLARQELFNWFDQLIKDYRLKTPRWVISEYTDRFINNKTTDYTPPLKQLVADTDNNFKEIKKYVSMLLTDDMAESINLSSRNEYISELNKIISIFSKLKGISSKSNSENYEIHEQIKDKLEKTILTSNINKIISDASYQVKSRYECRLPPGYKDEKKENNKGNHYGDLVVWFEILEYCQKCSINKVIFITNDMKKDWVYTPPKRKDVSGRLKPNLNPEIKICDPRLVSEFESITGSNEFHIINFLNLVELLSSNSQSFNELAKAVQIDLDQSELDLQQEQNVPDSSTEQINQIDEITNYSVNAIADIDFPLHEDKKIINIIKGLKSHYYYTQNDAMSEINDQVLSNATQDELFVLGRNIYQAACGGSFNASAFVNNLRNKLSLFKPEKFIDIFNGMLFEVYFNSKGEFRDILKTNKVQQLFDIFNSNNNFIQKSINFISEKLEIHKDQLLFLPKDFKQIDISINLNYSEDLKLYKVNSIKYSNTELIIKNEKYILGILDRRNRKENLIKLIADKICIPKYNIKPNFTPDITEFDETFVDYGKDILYVPQNLSN